MSIEQDLGFRSRLVLHKLGHDLGRSLDADGGAPLPESWHALIDEIGDRADETLTLHLHRNDDPALGRDSIVFDGD
ncbi:hypothetical protein HNR00_003971 [Methylorubrum rhodinum]|jgi:hypothetical protein|uniref:Uncharacterized protein n=1 Tax=Methylorubrum rhodinum TaxID=29428 RepID=A0A840ZMH2_9HYPH|nr:hypothetical protein [Methylorubrum rhodinum]MBB5759239.1 hypothetical protein [Methylorubrum rhodinum]